jgi:hypothetical protein
MVGKGTKRGLDVALSREKFEGGIEESATGCFAMLLDQGGTDARHHAIISGYGLFRLPVGFDRR